MTFLIIAYGFEDFANELGDAKEEKFFYEYKLFTHMYGLAS